MKYIAVLITVHNRKEKTLECLEHLFAQQDINGYEIEVYLTDDGCTDGTREAIAGLFSNVNIVDGNGNLYWNRGMYRAWEAAVKVKDYDYYLWLNDDTILKKFSLYVILNTSNQLQNTSIIVGATSSSQDEKQITYGGRDKTGKIIPPNSVPQLCYFFNGNVVLIPKKVYQIVGLNSPIFHHALGDFDYGLRANKLKVKSFLAPFIIGICNIPSALPDWCNPKIEFKQRWKKFRTPTGHNPEEFFIFSLRHNGLIKACFYYILNHIRVIFPKIWVILN